MFIIKNDKPQNTSNRITISTLLFGFYTAIIPINQIMNFTGHGTINRYLGIIVIISISMSMLLRKQKFRIEKSHIVIILYAIISLSSYFWSVNKDITITTIISLVSLIIFFVVCTNKTFSNTEIKFIKVCIIIGGLLLSIYLLYTKDSFYNRVFIVTNSGQRIDPNGLSASLAFGLIVLLSYAFSTKKKVNLLIVIACMVILLYAMLLTGSRGGLLGLIVGGFIYMAIGVQRKDLSKSKLLFFIIIAFVLWMFVLNSENLSQYFNLRVLERLSIDSALETGGSGRLTVWANALQLLGDKPLLGYGFATGPYLMKHYYGIFIGTHNDIFYLLLSTGLLGFTLFSYFIITIIKSVLIRKDILGLSMVVMTLVIGLTVDFILNKNFWNIMIYSQIGLSVYKSNTV